MRRILAVALIGTAAIALSACQSIRDAATGGRDAPDEFAVVTKAPLVIPPDFNLRPPAPGAAPTNQVDATVAAQTALFNADPATVAASLPTTMSMGERYLLAYAHVNDADPAIRQQIAADTRGLRGSDDGFTSAILFGAPTADASSPVDADAEARRLEAARAAGTAPAAGTPSGSAAPPAPPPPPENKDDGWLGNIWPF